ncbi:hypothetical protein KY362_05195 [Candidatus Woesearchaeota archaeon]|nr:hypothetical protein [Candidatus Woesearchaeota archaeon]
MKTATKPSRCHKCIRRAKHKLVDKWYCERCFCGLVEQSVRRHLRTYGLKRDVRLAVNDKASEYMLKRVLKVPVEIVSGRRKADFLVMPWTLDDENEEFLKMVIENRKLTVRENRKVIKLFYPVSKKDMKQYFKLKKISYRPEKTKMNALLDALEEKHPGTKRSLLKSREKLGEMQHLK